MSEKQVAWAGMFAGTAVGLACASILAILADWLAWDGLVFRLVLLWAGIAVSFVALFLVFKVRRLNQKATVGA